MHLAALPVIMRCWDASPLAVKRYSPSEVASQSLRCSIRISRQCLGWADPRWKAECSSSDRFTYHGLVRGCKRLLFQGDRSGAAVPVLPSPRNREQLAELEGELDEAGVGELIKDLISRSRDQVAGSRSPSTTRRHRVVGKRFGTPQVFRNGNKKTNLVRISHVVKVHQSQEIFDGQTFTAG